MISFEDFSKLDLRVAHILEAEPIEGSEKLLKLRVNAGSEIGEKQILAGIAKTHEPEDLIGRQIVIVANLEPRKMMGEESQGMLLAAGSDDGPILLMPENEAVPGSKIS